MLRWPARGEAAAGIGKTMKSSIKLRDAWAMTSISLHEFDREPKLNQPKRCGTCRSSELAVWEMARVHLAICVTIDLDRNHS